MSVRLGQCQRGVHILRNDRARQQIAHNILIFFIKLINIVKLCAKKINKAVHTASDNSSAYMYACTFIHISYRSYTLFITNKAF